MLISLTKLNCTAGNEKQVFVNTEAIGYFHAHSKDPNDGTEMHMTNGSIIKVRESPSVIILLMIDDKKMLLVEKEQRHAMAS